MAEPSSTNATTDPAARVAMASPVHLRRWLRETGRTWIILRTDDLVQALPWPHGVNALIQILEAYRQGRCVRQVEDYTNRGEKYNRQLGDQLELDEMILARDWLSTLIEDERARLAAGEQEYRDATAKTRPRMGAPR